MSRGLDQIIDYTTAPLVQWEPAIDEPLSPGKAHEDRLTHSAVVKVLRDLDARDITGIIADEARFEAYAVENLPNLYSANHLTLSGQFLKAADKTASEFWAKKQSNFRLYVTDDADDIGSHSQDAVVMNMILGCLATEQDHANVHKILTFAAGLLKPKGNLVIVRPNPEGGEFSTYACTTPAAELKSGKDYKFIVKGLEAFGEMANLYTPDSFLRAHMDAAGFDVGRTQPIEDRTVRDRINAKPPFLLNVCTLK